MAYLFPSRSGTKAVSRTNLPQDKIPPDFEGEKPRITVEAYHAGEAAEVFVYLNESGRDIFIEELSDLSHKNDHFHLGAPEWTGLEEDPLSMIAYGQGATVAGHLKVLFRPDEWDKEYYPHLMKRKPANIRSVRNPNFWN